MLPDRNQNVMQEILLYAEIYKPWKNENENRIHGEETEEEDYSIVDAVVASLNLTENMNLALDYRMSGMSYPDIGRMLSRATSTVYEYFIKMRQRYSAIYDVQNR